MSLVFGLGSGRCGTGSLAKILGVPHEGNAVPWKHHENRYLEVLEMARKTGGNVACYWLPYVVRLIQDEPKARFICLQRDRGATIKSWIKELKGRKRFENAAWFMDEGKPVSLSFLPDYGDMPIGEAVPLYYDHYYRQARILRDTYPTRFAIFDSLRVLNDRKAQREMLRFAKVKRPVQLHVRVHGRSRAEGVEVHRFTCRKCLPSEDLCLKWKSR